MKVVVWVCESCGFEKEGRCKPQKCSNCGGKGSFIKRRKPKEGGIKLVKDSFSQVKKRWINRTFHHKKNNPSHRASASCYWFLSTGEG